MEEEGQKIIKLNIGNLAVFGLEPPDEIVQDMIRNLPHSGRLHRFQGPVRAAQGGGALHASKSTSPGVDGRRRLPRQRRLRADRDEHERAAQRRRRGAGAGARLPAVDGGGRRCRAARRVHYLCDEQAGWLPDIDDISAEDHAEHQGHRRHQPEQPDRRAVSATSVLREIVEVARAAPADRLRRRDLRQDALRRRHAHQHRRRSPTTCCSSPSTACRRTTAPAATAPAGWWCRARSAMRSDYIEGLNMLASMRLCAEHARAARDPDRARRLPEHRRPGRAGRAPVPAARPGLRAADADSRA